MHNSKPIITCPDDVYDEMIFDLRNGKKKGTTTYINSIDPAWTWRESEFTIISGYSNEGKSEKLKQLCLIKALEENKKFVFYSPEDYPSSEFFAGMIHTLTGRSTDRENPNFITEKLYNKAFDLIKDKFHFLYIQPPGNTLEAIIAAFNQIIIKEDIFGFIVDPYIKVSRSKLAPDRDDLYGAYFTNLLGDFARVNEVCTFLIMHQQTPKRLESTNLYPEPNMYSIKSGGTFSDTADNVLTVWRKNYAKDKIDTSVIFGSQKIKKQKLVGIPQNVNMAFDRKTNRYVDAITGYPLYDFDKWI